MLLLKFIVGRETCPLVPDPPHENKPYVVLRLGEKIAQVLEINAIFSRNFSLKLGAELFTGVLDLVSEANLDFLEKQLPEKILRCVGPKVRLFRKDQFKSLLDFLNFAQALTFGQLHLQKKLPEFF